MVSLEFKAAPDKVLYILISTYISWLQLSETLNYCITMAFRFSGFVLTVFLHVDCNRLGTSGSGGGGNGGRGLIDATYSFDLVYMSTFTFKILKVLSCSV